MARVKSAAQRAPQSTQEAVGRCQRFAAVDAAIELIEAAKAEAIAAAAAKADAELVPLIAERKDLQKQVQAWWAANVDALTGGKRKSIELGGCELGDRLSPPKLVFAHGKDDAAVAALQSAGLDRLLRVKPAPDKPAILKALDPASGGDTADVLAELGFAAEQKEEFFLGRAGTAQAIADAP